MSAVLSPRTRALSALRLVLLAGFLVTHAQLATGASPPLTNTSGPLCAKLPLAADGLLSKIPAPPATALCPTLLDGRLPFCGLAAVLETALTLTGGRIKCNQDSQVDPPGSPVAFADRRPLPAGNFPDGAAVLRAEGATYSWLYRLIQNVEAYLPCALAGAGEWAPPVGWELIAMLNITEPGGQVAPFAAVTLNEEASQLVVALRGTMLPGEWALDFSYNQTEVADNLFGSPVHWGFGRVFDELWPDVQAALFDLVLGPSPAASQVFIAGHSLGGGVATLLAFAAQQFLEGEAAAAGAGPANGTAPLVSVLLVAPPSVGPPDFMARFNRLVNARRLAFEYDIVPQAFCSPTMPACSAGQQPGALGGQLSRAGLQVIPTNQPGNVSSWSYAAVGGSLPFGPSGMPQDAASWTALQNIQLCWSLSFLAATHICSYACFTSQFAPAAAAADSSCWLSARPQGSPPGVQCAGWPTDYPPAV